MHWIWSTVPHKIVSFSIIHQVYAKRKKILIKRITVIKLLLNYHPDFNILILLSPEYATQHILDFLCCISRDIITLF